MRGALGGAFIVVRACAPKTVQAFCAFRGGARQGDAKESARLMQTKVLFFPKDLCEAAALATRLFSVKTTIMGDVDVQSSNSAETEIIYSLSNL